MSSSFDQLDLMSAPGDGWIDFDQLVVSPRSMQLEQMLQSQSTNDKMELDNSEQLAVAHSPGARHAQVSLRALRPILPVGGTLTLASNSKPKRYSNDEIQMTNGGQDSEKCQEHPRQQQIREQRGPRL
jgi:hypothetical protein